MAAIAATPSATTTATSTATSSATHGQQQHQQAYQHQQWRRIATAQAAATAPSKKRQEAELAITTAVADALHLIGALKQSIGLMSGTLFIFIFVRRLIAVV